MSGRPEPPSGTSAPASVTLRDGSQLDLVELAREVCRRYDAEFPDERERYGPAGMAWCVHDNQHLVNWAVGDVHHGFVDLAAQVAWLANVLAARDFPLDRLARNLVIAGEVVQERLGDAALAERLREVAAGVG